MSTKFEVRFKHDDGGLTLTFRNALATMTAYTDGNTFSVMFRDKTECDTFFEAVEQEQAARYGDATTLGQDSDLDPSYEEVFYDDPKTDERKTEAWLDDLPVLPPDEDKNYTPGGQGW